MPAQRGAHPGVEQRGEFLGVAVAGRAAGEAVPRCGVQVDFGRARGQARQQGGEAVGGEGAAPGEAHHAVRRREPVPRGQAAQQRGEGPERAGCGARSRVHGADQRGRLPGDADGADAGVARRAEGHGGDDGVKVEVLVGVQVVASEAGRAERLDLRRDLGPQLRPRFCRRRQRGAQPRHVVAETPVAPNQRRDALGREHGRAIREREVQAHREAGVAPRDLHRLRRRALRPPSGWPR